MNIGFIGAGKVGCSLGKYFKTHQQHISGYYSRTYASAKEAAKFTGSKCYDSIAQLLSDSDILFLTVPDGTIKKVWDQIVLENLPINGKIICHTSGSLPSTIFSGIESKGAFGYSIHPLFAICDKQTSYKDLSKAVFTIEGNQHDIKYFEDLFEKMGNQYAVIGASNKAKYHAAAVMVSNQMLALICMGQELLKQCGFDETVARHALNSLIEGNITNYLEHGLKDALTGPIERNDIVTVQNHKKVLENDYLDVYCRLSKVLVELAQAKHNETDYSKMVKELTLK